VRKRRIKIRRRRARKNAEKYKYSYIHTHVRYVTQLLNIEEISHKQKFKSNAAVSNHKRNCYTVLNREGTWCITGLNCETHQKEI
jgi:hypothetical protein